MAWLTANWFWILIFIAFISMHLVGHGGHGGHGSQGGDASPRNTDEADRNAPRGRDSTSRSSEHQH